MVVGRGAGHGLQDQSAGDRCATALVMDMFFNWSLLPRIHSVVLHAASVERNYHLLYSETYHRVALMLS